MSGNNTVTARQESWGGTTNPGCLQAGLGGKSCQNVNYSPGTGSYFVMSFAIVFGKC